jgi:hypothetical protein
MKAFSSNIATTRLFTLATGLGLYLGSAYAVAQVHHSTDNGQTFTGPPLQSTVSPNETPAMASPSVGAMEEDAVQDTAKNTVPAHARKPVTLNFNRLPRKPWRLVTGGEGGTSVSVAHGILTINTPSDFAEFILDDPNGIWHKFVSNARGWVIEASLKIDPSTQPTGDGSEMIWANDHTNLVILQFNPGSVYLAYPDFVPVQMDTTDAFHVYRMESKGTNVRVYVDGQLKIDHTLSQPGGGSNILAFGDGSGGGPPNLTQWDYFSYDVFPEGL